MADKNIAKKEKAIEIMKKMDIYKPYIKGFRESDKVCFFEGFGGFWIDQEPELHEKMKAIEEKHKCKVYAVTHEYTEFGALRLPYRNRLSRRMGYARVHRRQPSYGFRLCLEQRRRLVQ